MDSTTPHMNWVSNDFISVLSLFRQKCQFYFSVKEIKEEKQVDHIFLYNGDIKLQIYNSWDLTDSLRKEPKVI